MHDLIARVPESASISARGQVEHSLAKLARISDATIALCFSGTPSSFTIALELLKKRLEVEVGSALSNNERFTKESSISVRVSRASPYSLKTFSRTSSKSG